MTSGCYYASAPLGSGGGAGAPPHVYSCVGQLLQTDEVVLHAGFGKIAIKFEETNWSIYRRRLKRERDYCIGRIGISSRLWICSCVRLVDGEIVSAADVLCHVMNNRIIARSLTGISMIRC